MPRIRTIKPEFWEDEKIASLHMTCRLFFIGLWNFADDAGVLRANVSLLKSKIFPYDDIRTSEIQKHLDALVEARMILPVSHSGESFYVIRTFRSHQKFDARYPNYLIDSEILKKLMCDQIPPNEHPTGTQREPATVRGEGKGRVKGEVIPPKSPTGELAEWRTDFDAYLNDLRKAYQKLIADNEWITEKQKYHPNLDIKLSIERACKEYWATEAGWALKCKDKKAITINWKATLSKTIDKNRVYKEKTTNEKNENITF